MGLPIGFLVGLLAAAVVAGLLFYFRRDALRTRERAVLEKARLQGEQIKRDAELVAKEELLRVQGEAEQKVRKLRSELEEERRRVRGKEEQVERRLKDFNKKEKYLERVDRELEENRKKTDALRSELTETLEEQRLLLHTCSGMTREQAQEELMKRLSRDMEEESGALIRRVVARAEEEAREKARNILTLAIQRCASEQSAQSSVTTMEIPGDEIKGRIIGREGRNIHAFERATGVDVIVDDTPGVVILSSFDPVRREVARQAMEKLIRDGRIHPAHVEEVVKQTREEVEKSIVEIGRQAVFEAGVHGLQDRQIQALGRLHFLSSNGQNMLRHTMEVVQLSQALASELGLDVQLAKRAGLLHDLGRAIGQEMEGSHSAVGAALAKRCNERPEVVNAIASHHGEIPPLTLYALVLQAANVVSRARPGVAREGLERYVERMGRLEELARKFGGVKEAYAVRTGREIRVAVDPEQISDNAAAKLAHDLAKEIEGELTYPAEIQVTVLREVRVKGRVR
jgi:ribonuclease Y